MSLVELLTVLVLVGVLASLAAPALDGMLAGMRARATLRQVVVDLYYARVLAVRTGSPVVVRFLAGARCPGGTGNRYGSDRYVVVVRGTPDRQVKSEALSRADGLCLEMNQSDSMRFDPRGLPRGAGNRTLVVRSRGFRDSVVISRLGRVLRPH